MLTPDEHTQVSGTLANLYSAQQALLRVLAHARQGEWFHREDVQAALDEVVIVVGKLLILNSYPSACELCGRHVPTLGETQKETST